MLVYSLEKYEPGRLDRVAGVRAIAARSICPWRPLARSRWRARPLADRGALAASVRTNVTFDNATSHNFAPVARPRTI